jgi:hypothetical protein
MFSRTDSAQNESCLNKSFVNVTSATELAEISFCYYVAKSHLLERDRFI